MQKPTIKVSSLVGFILYEHHFDSKQNSCNICSKIQKNKYDVPEFREHIFEGMSLEFCY